MAPEPDSDTSPDRHTPNPEPDMRSLDHNLAGQMACPGVATRAVANLGSPWSPATWSTGTDAFAGYAAIAETKHRYQRPPEPSP